MIVKDWKVENKINLIEDFTVYKNLLYLAENDKEKAIPSITSEKIISIVYQQKKVCKIYCISLLFQGYPKHYSQSFLIDQIDDSKGHYL